MSVTKHKMVGLSDCIRYEELISSSGDDLTNDDCEFLVRHQESCKLGIHTDEALEDLEGWPQGTLKNWNGRDPLPPPRARPPGSGP